MEAYTIKFPYPIKNLEAIIKKKITPLQRIDVEKEDFLADAKKNTIALLVYGSPLAATTHISLLLKCKREHIPYKVLHNASIFDAIAETGLQMYKFGKTASMPQWTPTYRPDSFLEIIKQNLSSDAHTLILVDIPLSFTDALNQLTEAIQTHGMNISKIIACSKLGLKNQKICYDSISHLSHREFEPPFCFIIPSKLHFLEEEYLNSL